MDKETKSEKKKWGTKRNLGCLGTKVKYNFLPINSKGISHKKWGGH
jgi:hypothetical protein